MDDALKLNIIVATMYYCRVVCEALGESQTEAQQLFNDNFNALAPTKNLHDMTQKEIRAILLTVSRKAVQLLEGR